MTPAAWTALKIRLLDLAEITDAWRLVPRMVLAAYGAMCWQLTAWYMALKAPTTEQMAFVSLIVGLAVPLTNFYMSTGRKWQ
jgi:phosphate/sulfate permease